MVGIATQVGGMMTSRPCDRAIRSPEAAGGQPRPDVSAARHGRDSPPPWDASDLAFPAPRSKGGAADTAAENARPQRTVLAALFASSLCPDTAQFLFDDLGPDSGASFRRNSVSIRRAGRATVVVASATASVRSRMEAPVTGVATSSVVSVSAPSASTSGSNAVRRRFRTRPEDACKP